jgi:Tol biopolymer transport system component
MKMKIAFMLIIALSSFTLASWPTPFFMSNPPNNISRSNNDAEFGLCADELYIVQCTDICFTHKTGTTWNSPVQIAAFHRYEFNYSPALTGNGQRMYFCSGDAFHNWEIYTSDKVGGVWQTAIKLPPPINSVDDEWAVAVSPDGNTLYFSSNRDDGGNMDFDIFRSSWTGGGWATPIKLTNLRTDLVEEVCDVSSDGTKLYFSRMDWIMSATTGDLYVSTFNGTWGIPEPINDLNSVQYVEHGATISPSNDHIAFCSDRDDIAASNLWESIKQVGVNPTSLGSIKASFK